MTRMDAASLIQQLENLDVTIAMDGVDLVLRPASPIPADMVSLLKAHKAELLAYLSRPRIEVVPERCPTCGSRLRRADVGCVRCYEGIPSNNPCGACGRLAWVFDPTFSAEGGMFPAWVCSVCEAGIR